MCISPEQVSNCELGGVLRVFSSQHVDSRRCCQLISTDDRAHFVALIVRIRLQHNGCNAVVIRLAFCVSFFYNCEFLKQVNVAIESRGFVCDSIANDAAAVISIPIFGTSLAVRRQHITNVPVGWSRAQDATRPVHLI